MHVVIITIVNPMTSATTTRKLDPENIWIAVDILSLCTR